MRYTIVCKIVGDMWIELHEQEFQSDNPELLDVPEFPNDEHFAFALIVEN